MFEKPSENNQETQKAELREKDLAIQIKEGELDYAKITLNPDSREEIAKYIRDRLDLIQEEKQFAELKHTVSFLSDLDFKERDKNWNEKRENLGALNKREEFLTKSLQTPQDSNFEEIRQGILKTQAEKKVSDYLRNAERELNSKGRGLKSEHEKNVYRLAGFGDTASKNYDFETAFKVMELTRDYVYEEDIKRLEGRIDLAEKEGRDVARAKDSLKAFKESLK